MLINLSSDNIYILTWNQRIDISRGKLERNISQTIIDIYNQYKPQNIYIINWPWSFTNLRLGCLAINLLNYILSKTGQKLPNMYITDKVTIFKTLERPSLIYIGQKNNYRLLNNGEIEKVSIGDLDQKKLYFDDLSDNIYIWLPKVIFEYTGNNVYMTYDDLYLVDINNNKNITWIFQIIIWTLSPNYMMEPNIW